MYVCSVQLIIGSSGESLSYKEYFAHIEISPETMKGSKIRPKCICPVQPFIRRGGGVYVISESRISRSYRVVTIDHEDN